MMLKVNSIQGRLMQLVLVVTTFVLFLTTASFFAYEFYSYREAAKERLSTLGKVIALNSSTAISTSDKSDATETLQSLQAERHIVVACLYDNNGKIFAIYPDSAALKNLSASTVLAGFTYDEGYLHGFVPVIKNGKQLGKVYLKSDVKAIYLRFEKYAVIALLVFLLSVLIAFLLTRQLQKSISTPILNLVNIADNVSNKHDYAVRAEKLGDDELGKLTDAFNKMLEQIERQNEEITSFNHELELKVIERTIELEDANTDLQLKSEFEETIINSSIDMIAVFDLEHRYVVLNEYGKAAFGLEGKEVIGKNVIELFPQLKDSIMYRHLQDVFREGKIIHDPSYKSYVSKRVMDNYFIPLNDEFGRVYRVLVIGHDITEISEANEKLKELNKELEKSNLELEQFAYVASHDLQEPLRKIQVFSDLVLSQVADSDPTKKLVEKILGSANRLTDLIRAVLNYSKLLGEKQQFEKVDLNEIVENIKIDLELAIAEKGAIIQHNILPVIPGHRLQLSQLLLNLISNSLKFSSLHPHIEIIGTINTSYKGEQSLELVFKDNGIGFEEQYAEKIFTVFQRLHNKQEYPGTGIGLALVKKIVDNHKGTIAVQSVPGVGTTFTISLPVAVYQQAAALVN